jgi:hypothetical protein
MNGKHVEFSFLDFKFSGCAIRFTLLGRDDHMILKMLTTLTFIPAQQPTMAQKLNSCRNFIQKLDWDPEFGKDI